MAFDAVVFDLDETLFDHRGAARDGVAAWLSRLGVTATAETISLWFAAEARFVAAWQRDELDWQGQRRARLRYMLAELGLPSGNDDAVDASFSVYLGNYERAWRAFGDAVPALEAIARADLQIAVLTNGADYQQRAKLAACGLSELVGPVFSSDVIGFAKPAPRAYRHVCEQLRVDPSHVVHVGDRYDLDVVAARAAGLNAIYLDRLDNGPEDEAARICSLVELPGHLGLTRTAD